MAAEVTSGVNQITRNINSPSLLDMSFYPVAGPLSTNARDPGTTIRNPSTALLCIDSEDRFKDFPEARANTNVANPSSPFNFAISKPENIMAGFFTRVGLTEVAFPWVIPNINIKSQQIRLQWNLNDVAQTVSTITIPYGFYTPDNLATAMSVAINGIVNAVVPGANAIQFFYNYKRNSFGPRPTPDSDLSGNELSFTYYSTNPTIDISFLPMVYGSPAYPYPASTKQLFDVLGFGSINSAFGANHGEATFCQWTRFVDITCQQLTLNQSLKDAASQPTVHDMLARLYVSAAPGQSSTTSAPLTGAANQCFPGNAPTTIYKDYSHPKQIQWLPNQNVPGFLRFVVYDDSGADLSEAVYNDGTSVNWSTTLQFSEN